MMLNILVESNISAILLLKLMDPELQAGLVEFRCAYPSSSLYSAAKTLRQFRREPVAIVLDAGSTEPKMADHIRDEAAEVIGESTAAPLRILVAVPSLDSLAFRRPDAVRRAYANATSEMIDLGLVSPGDALLRLSPIADYHQSLLEIISNLNSSDIAALRLESPVRELLEFLAGLGLNGGVVHAATAVSS
jgi:hypothetical protein